MYERPACTLKLISPVFMLICIFFQNIVNKGEECLLLDNSEHHSWKVCLSCNHEVILFLIVLQTSVEKRKSNEFNLEIGGIYMQKLVIKESDVSAISWHHCQGKLN